MKQMMFAKEFPGNHSKKGQPTLFPEKIWAGLADRGFLMDDVNLGNYPMDFYSYYNATPKHHTIRAGHRWKVGDIFLPKIWSGKPYRSKTITFGPPIEVKKVWDIRINTNDKILINELFWPAWEYLAKNDGLSRGDFAEWFAAAENFEGQIICWNEKLVYV